MAVYYILEKIYFYIMKMHLNVGIHTVLTRMNNNKY